MLRVISDIGITGSAVKGLNTALFSIECINKATDEPSVASRECRDCDDGS